VRRSDRHPGPYPYYGASGIVDHVDDFLFDGDFLLIAEDGENLRTKRTPIAFRATGQFWVNNHAHVLSGANGNDTRFLTYALQQVDVSAFITGSTQPKLSQANLTRIPLSVPPPAEQRAIASILGRIDDKIDLGHRIADTLQRMAWSLFRSWFVDFDPIRRPSTVSAATRDVFPDRLVDSPLGWVPAGWQVSQLGQYAVSLLGGTPARDNAEYWADGEIPWINSGEVNRFRIVEPTAWITEEGLQNSATKLLPERTTVIAITGATLGQVSLTEIATCANQSVVGVIGSEVLPSEFIYFWVRERIADLVGRQTGGAQQHVNKGDVDALRVLVPSTSAMGLYVEAARPMFDLIRATCFESRTLGQLRDALLPKLISGQLRVPADVTR
jgi:type I restriction enzyme S subunit